MLLSNQALCLKLLATNLWRTFKQPNLAQAGPWWAFKTGKTQKTYLGSRSGDARTFLVTLSILLGQSVSSLVKDVKFIALKKIVGALPNILFLSCLAFCFQQLQTNRLTNMLVSNKIIFWLVKKHLAASVGIHFWENNKCCTSMRHLSKDTLLIS